jgi:hypothetical protein
MTKQLGWRDVQEILGGAYAHAERRARAADLSATIELTSIGFLIHLQRAGKMVFMTSLDFEAALLAGELNKQIDRAFDSVHPEAPDDVDLSGHLPRVPDKS